MPVNNANSFDGDTKIDEEQIQNEMDEKTKFKEKDLMVNPYQISIEPTRRYRLKNDKIGTSNCQVQVDLDWTKNKKCIGMEMESIDCAENKCNEQEFLVLEILKIDEMIHDLGKPVQCIPQPTFDDGKKVIKQAIASKV